MTNFMFIVLSHNRCYFSRHFLKLFVWKTIKSEIKRKNRRSNETRCVYSRRGKRLL